MDDDDAEPMDDAADEETPGTLVAGQPDINGDGQVIVGIASPGDTNDGGFYQSFVDGARSFAEEAGWTVIVSTSPLHRGRSSACSARTGRASRRS